MNNIERLSVFLELYNNLKKSNYNSKNLANAQRINFEKVLNMNKGNLNPKEQ